MNFTTELPVLLTHGPVLRPVIYGIEFYGVRYLILTGLLL